jgi:hypothetical protein
MKNLLRIENATMFLFSIYLFSLLEFEWWWYLVLILTPDIGMLGYIFNPKFGAITYNIFHHKGIALALYLAGIYLNNDLIILTGIILFGHSSLDRIFGYGLKYNDSFIHTHLGMLKKNNNV